jgi:anti-anti-sigma factor
MVQVQRLTGGAAGYRMQISTVFEHDTTVVLAVTGGVDVATADDVRDVGLGVLACSQCTTLWVDPSGVTFLDSTGLGALIALHHAAVASARRLVLRDPCPSTRRLLQLTGLSAVFEVIGPAATG